MKSLKHNHAIIITGGPGAGKTTLLNCFHENGFQIKPEAGRAVIREQIARQTSALPWRDPAAFAQAMFEKEIEWYHTLTRHDKPARPLFCDRGLPDIAGYLHLNHLPVPQHIDTAIRQLRYNSTVFITPFWQEIYQQDHERKQSPEEAEATFHQMLTTYSDYGYHTILIPQTNVQERFRFLIEHVGDLI